MSSYKKIALLFLSGLLTISVTAQQPGTDLPEAGVDVIKHFDARLAESERQALNPELPPLDTTTQRQEYSNILKTLAVDYLPPKIRPLAMRGEELPPTYKGYAKLGAGYPSSFFGEASYNLFSESGLDLGLSVLHHSANNTKKVENQRFSYNNFGLDGTYYADQGFAINGNLAYTTDAVHFYGYNDLAEEVGKEISFSQDEVKQRFATFSGGASIFNGERTAADFNYHAGFEFYGLKDNYAARENGLKLTIGGTKWFDETHPLTVKLITDFTSYKDTSNQALNNFFLQPSYTFQGDVFQAKIGLNLASNSDQFSFFPDVEVSANVVPSVLAAFVGAEGSLKKNNFKTLSDYNPFIVSRVDIKNTKYYHFYGGVKGNFSDINYRAQVGYKNADGVALFLLNNDTIPRFNVLYDSMNIITIQGSLSFPLFTNIQIYGAASQSIFSGGSQEKPWHLPSLIVNIGAKYTNDAENLIFKGEFFLENGVPYKDAMGNAQNLNALFDISLGAEYFVSEKNWNIPSGK